MGFDTELQKEIWLKHIEVQERVLQLNSAPIAIEPDSIQILGQRLRLNICQTDELDTILSRVKALFNAGDDDINDIDDTILCDSHFEPDVDQLYQLAEECQKYYVHLSTNPIIEGVIRSQKSTFSKCVKALKDIGEQYAIDTKRRLQVTVNALRKLDKDATFPNDILPDKASGIFGIAPTPAYFLRKWFFVDCTHRVSYSNIKLEEGEERRISRLLTIHDHYLTEAATQKLNELWGLRLHSFNVIIELTEEIHKTHNFKKSLYEFPDSDNGKYRFNFNIRSTEVNRRLIGQRTGTKSRY